MSDEIEKISQKILDNLSSTCNASEIMAWYLATDPLMMAANMEFSFKNCPHIDKDNYKPGDVIDLNAMTAKCKECDIKDKS